jgi:hypothetical protein
MIQSGDGAVAQDMRISRTKLRLGVDGNSSQLSNAAW